VITLYASGQVALDPATGPALWKAGVAEQTVRVPKTLRQSLRKQALGLPMWSRPTVFFEEHGRTFAAMNGKSTRGTWLRRASFARKRSTVRRSAS